MTQRPAALAGQPGPSSPDDRPVRAILFDLGGVLLNIDFQRSFEAWGLAAGVDPQVLAARFAMDDAYRRHERGQIDAACYFASLSRQLAITLPFDLWLQGWNALLLDEITGIRERVLRARQFGPVCIFSNTNAAHSQAWMQAHPGLLALFDKVFTSSALGLRKPEPAAFAAVLAAMGVDAAQALFFDDTPENIEGARQIGLRAVLVREIADIDNALACLPRLGGA